MTAPKLIGSQGESLREAFGKAISTLAINDKRIVVLDGDVAGGTGTHHVRRNCPEQFIQMGIAEQNMVSAAAGMAQTGLIPIVTTFAVFSLRAIEQCRLSVACQNQNVKIVASHPGLDVGPDGASAQCLEDIAMYRAIPNMTVIVPSDPIEMEKATAAIIEHDGPVYMRTGRSGAPTFQSSDMTFTIGKAQILRDGTDVTIFAMGVMVARALRAAETLSQRNIDAAVINISTVKPLDVDTVTQFASRTGAVVTAEDHNVIGGLGSCIAEALAQHSPAPMEMVGVKDSFGQSGSPDELASHFQIDEQSIVNAVTKVLRRK